MRLLKIVVWGLSLIFLVTIPLLQTSAQINPNAPHGNVSRGPNTRGHAYVDARGVLRWQGTEEEVKGFGVNYSVPFAHAYRMAQRLGLDPKEAMRNDVYHFSRLGFNLYRLHVWDTEISDSTGTLLKNEHLDAFDFLINELRNKGFNYVLTPIAFWGNGWPEPDTYSPGFSAKYGKDNCLTDPACIAAQQKYLSEFLNHVNPYTSLAYKDDPNVIAFEVSNEPHHRGQGAEVTAFVKGMVNAMRRTGTKKPIFYNISHGVHFVDDYFAAGIQGGTFQWYPTGLGYGKELEGNLLPNVDRYEIPFETQIKQWGGAKLVYEFDAADVGRSYIYPAMARSFRTAGIQIATHFAYDPTYLAYANTEYNTHYMNLAYTPQKALSLMICSRVFQEVPMYQEFGGYPQNTRFGNFSVSYENDLAEYNTDETFIYTNSTQTLPKNTNKLTQVAGYGTSSVVSYSGFGAYFLDKLDKGVWRLEVMPDAYWVANPFGRNSPDKTIGVIKWQQHQMTLNLPNLDKKFRVQAINVGNDFSPEVNGSNFSIKPGTYIISADGKKKPGQASNTFGYNKLGDFYAPRSKLEDAYFTHNRRQQHTAGTPLPISAQLVAPQNPVKLELWAYDGWRPTVLPMQLSGKEYQATLPAEIVKPGYLTYHIVAQWPDSSYTTYPANQPGRPFDWNFYKREPYTVAIVPAEYPVQLFSAATDVDHLVRPWREGFSVLPRPEPGEAEYQIRLEKLFVPDNENLKAEPVYDYSFKHFVLDELAGRKSVLKNKTELVLKGRALTGKPEKIQLALVTKNGVAYGGLLELSSDMAEYVLPLSELKPVPTVVLPRPYPTFLPYYFQPTTNEPLQLEDVESLQFSIGPGLTEVKQQQAHSVGVVSVMLR